MESWQCRSRSKQNLNGCCPELHSSITSTTVLNHLSRQCADDFDDSAPCATRSKEKLMVFDVVEVPGHIVGKIKSIGFRMSYFSCNSCKQWSKNMENLPTFTSRNANLNGGEDFTAQWSWERLFTFIFTFTLPCSFCCHRISRWVIFRSHPFRWIRKLALCRCPPGL